MIQQFSSERITARLAAGVEQLTGQAPAVTRMSQTRNWRLDIQGLTTDEVMALRTLLEEEGVPAAQVTREAVDAKLDEWRQVREAAEAADAAAAEAPNTPRELTKEEAEHFRDLMREEQQQA